MKLFFKILLILSFCLFLMNPGTQSMIISNISQQNSSSGLNYKVYNTYANGTKIYKFQKNTNDPSPFKNLNLASVAPNPLGTADTALMGSTNFIVNQWQQTTTSYSTSITNYDPRGVNSLSTTLNRAINGGNTQGTTQFATSTAIGDLLGNYQSELITAYTYNDGANYHIRLKIQEQWGMPGFISTLAENTLTDLTNPVSTANSYSPAQVFTANLDGDRMSEFIVVGQGSGGNAVWIFNDLVNNTIPRPIHYGDQISFKTYFSPDSYLASSSSTVFVNNPYSASLINPQVVFTILNPIDLSSKNVVAYNEPFILENSYNQLLTVLSSTSGISLSTYTGNSNANNYFTFVGPNDPSTNANVTTNGFVNLKSATNAYIFASNTAGTETIGTNEEDILQVVSSSNIPYDLQRTNTNGQLLYVKEIQDPNFASYQVYNPSTGFCLPTCPAPTVNNFGIRTVAVGNIGNNTAPEFAVVGFDSNNDPIAWVYGNMSTNFALLHQFRWNSGTDTGKSPSVAFGDVNGDGVPDLIFSLTNSNGGSIYVYDGKTYNLIKTIATNDPHYASIAPRLYTQDLNNNSQTEILFLQDNTTLTVFNSSIGNYAPILHEYVGAFLSGNWGSLAFGDFNRDTINDMLVVHSQNNTDSRGIALFDWNGTYFNLVQSSSLTIGGSQPYILRLSAGDFSGGTFDVHYTGYTYTQQTQGELNVVAAAPPSEFGISQNYGSTRTTFGTSVSNSQSTGNQITNGYGAYVQLSGQASFLDIVQAGPAIKASINYKFSTTNTAVLTTTVTSSFTGSYTDDFVIYTAAIYHVFVYKILKATDPNMVGQNITINVPEVPAVFKQTVSYYNAHKNPSDLNIGTNIFNHTIGDLSSYPTKSQLLQRSSSLLTSSETQVGQGGGSDSVEIDLSTQNTQSFTSSYSYQIDASVEAKAFGVGAKVGATYTAGESSIYKISVGSKTAFKGSVGDISTATDYNNFHYGYGLGVYFLIIAQNSRLFAFYVINYWVTLPSGWGSNTTITSTPPGGATSSNPNSLNSSNGNSINSAKGFLDFYTDPLILLLFTIVIIRKKQKYRY